jgi:hypothetical protein
MTLKKAGPHSFHHKDTLGLSGVANLLSLAGIHRKWLLDQYVLAGFDCQQRVLSVKRVDG